MHKIDVRATIGWPTLAWCRRRKNCLCCGTFCTAVVLPLCAAKFLLLCLLVVLTLSTTLCRNLFRLAVLLVV